MRWSAAPEGAQQAFEKVFEPLERIQSRHSELSRDGPSAGSQAARDGETELGKIAWDLGLAASSIGVDHLVAWRMLRIRGGYQPNFAHWTLIRGAIEGMAVGRWLCDPAIDQDVRIGRALGVRLDDYEQRLAFERRMGSRLPKPTGKARTAEERIEAFKSRLGEVTPITMPNATELFGRFAVPDPKKLEGERLFRVISAIPHAKMWSLPALVTVTERVEQASGRLAAGMTPDESLVLGVTQVAMQVAADVLRDLESYGGSEPRP